MFLRQGGQGLPSQLEHFSEINPYFLQSEAFCDHFHDIIKVYFSWKFYD